MRGFRQWVLNIGNSRIREYSEQMEPGQILKMLSHIQFNADVSVVSIVWPHELKGPLNMTLDRTNKSELEQFQERIFKEINERAYFCFAAFYTIGKSPPEGPIVGAPKIPSVKLFCRALPQFDATPPALLGFEKRGSRHCYTHSFVANEDKQLSGKKGIEKTRLNAWIQG